MSSSLLDWEESENKGCGDPTHKTCECAEWREWELTENKRIDMVNSPPHYTRGTLEVIDVLENYFSENPRLWNAGKYLLRCLYKGHKEEDLRKCIWYINREIMHDANAVPAVPTEQ